MIISLSQQLRHWLRFTIYNTTQYIYSPYQSGMVCVCVCVCAPKPRPLNTHHRHRRRRRHRRHCKCKCKTQRINYAIECLSD